MFSVYRLVIEYDGTRYHGWQEQQNARSVAGVLREAIEERIGEVIELAASGRTDAGVHALAQVAHLKLRQAAELGSFLQSINEALPPDVHVLDVRPALSGFHARHDAVSRAYLYQISTRRTAFAKRYVWWVRRPLDPRAMAEAAALLQGRHDFRFFCERPSEQTSTIVVVTGAEIKTAGALILVRLVASHFLWKMVRRLVGALVKVGAGELRLGDFENLLAADPSACDASRPAEWTAPPSGLFLERVSYPGDPPLPPLSPVFAVPAETVPGPPRRVTRSARRGS
jgi:tRNA pseudouridine38-40 synthase